MKKKGYPSTQPNSLLFTPVSDCLDPVQDSHPGGPDRVQTVCLGYLQTTVETKYKDAPSISIHIHSKPYFAKPKKTISFAEMEIMDLLLRNKTNCW